MRAQLRRSAPDTVSAGDVQRGQARAARLARGRASCTLSPREFDLLTFLVANAGRTVTREQVMDAVWDGEWQGSNKTLDMNVVALRRKLGDDAPSTHARRHGQRGRPEV